MYAVVDLWGPALPFNPFIANPFPCTTGSTERRLIAAPLLSSVTPSLLVHVQTVNISLMIFSLVATSVTSRELDLI